MKSTLLCCDVKGDVLEMKQVRFMTTVQSSLGWCKPTLRFIVKIQRVDPRIFDVKIKKTLNKSFRTIIVGTFFTRNYDCIRS
jgi:hypothetical protein